MGGDSSDRDSRPSVVLASLALTVLVLSLAYVGSYYALVSRFPAVQSSGTVHHTPQYATRYTVVKQAFRPIHALDRRLRPGYWVEEIDWDTVLIEEP